MTRNPLIYAPMLLLGIAALLFVEWHTDEVTVVLALLLVVSAALGALRPHAAIITGIAIGLAIPLAHLATRLTGLYLPATKPRHPRSATRSPWRR